MDITSPTKIVKGVYIYEASKWPIENDTFNSGLIDLGNTVWGLFTLDPVTTSGIVKGTTKIFISSTQPSDDQSEVAVMPITNIEGTSINTENLGSIGKGIQVSVSPNSDTKKYNINIQSYITKDDNIANPVTHKIETNIPIEPTYKVTPDVVPITLNSGFMTDDYILPSYYEADGTAVFDFSQQPQGTDGLLQFPGIFKTGAMLLSKVKNVFPFSIVGNIEVGKIKTNLYQGDVSIQLKLNDEYVKKLNWEDPPGCKGVLFPDGMIQFGLTGLGNPNTDAMIENYSVKINAYKELKTNKFTFMIRLLGYGIGLTTAKLLSEIVVKTPIELDDEDFNPDNPFLD